MTHSLTDYADRRVLFFSGKGGTGKTIASAALAAQCAAAGKRTLWIELTENPRGHYLFQGYQPAYNPQEIRPQLWAMNLRFRPAVEEYLELVFRVRWLSRRIAGNQLFRIFTDTLPGLYALVVLGKVWHESEEMENGKPLWDQIIVDMPATGHGLVLFQLPGAALDIVPSGPVAERTHDIDNMLRDADRTGIVVVTLLEKLAVDESLEMIESLQRHTAYPLRGLVANCVFPDIGGDERERFRSWLEGGNDSAIAKALPDPLEEGFKARMRWMARRFDDQQPLRERLTELEAPLADLPWCPGNRDDRVLQSLLTHVGGGSRP
ncbi:MAG: ArsA-related P-loop ATPase [Ketobacteraceae bacterium]|nr:ArsA-related P-loop ATPase [Ketobacteraceae bacterium]